ADDPSVVVAERLGLRPEEPPSPFLLEAHRFAFEGEEVGANGGELRIAGIETVEKTDPLELVGQEGGAGAARPGAEAQLPVGGPGHRRHRRARKARAGAADPLRLVTKRGSPDLDHFGTGLFS